MLPLINPSADRYAQQHSSALPPHVQQVLKQTLLSHPHAHMISSELQGSLLYFYARLLQPNYILEIGTFTGFSAMCLAEGMPESATLHTIELRADDAATAKENFKLIKGNKHVHLHVGNALEVIPQLNHRWDMVFIDADKTGYIDYYELLLPRLSDHGLIIADNVLFHGQVLSDDLKGKNAKAIDAFNKHVAEDERTEQVLLTVRDGLLLIKKT